MEKIKCCSGKYERRCRLTPRGTISVACDAADRHNRVLQMFKKPQWGHGYALSGKKEREKEVGNNYSQKYSAGSKMFEKLQRRSIRA